MIDALRAQLKRHEGFSAKVYKDTLGVRTVGYGRNLDQRGLSRSEVIMILERTGVTKQEAEVLLNNDIAQALRDCEAHLLWWNILDEVRKLVIADMAFNLGISRLMGFSRMLTACAKHDWTTAAAEMRNSLWARQVKTRADRLSHMMETGILPPGPDCT